MLKTTREGQHRAHGTGSVIPADPPRRYKRNQHSTLT